MPPLPPPRRTRSFYFAGALGCALLLHLPLMGAAPSQITVKLSVLPGLKYDVPRFAVAPGGKVTIAFHNPDQMIHNFVVTEPGARLEVVMAALALGADGIARNFIPDSKKVLWHTKALAPGESTTLDFTAPTHEGVYPYVCTFPGHGFVMYGAMYVTTKALPPMESDPNVPPPAALVNDASDHSHHPLDRPVVSRLFYPDSGPASLAIGLPGGQSYLFDAGVCRLRYAWKDGFVDNNEHWLGKGDAFGKIVGRIYYRAPNVAPLRIGDPAKIPETRWRGYQLIHGFPRLEYTLDGVEVHEIAQLGAAKNGIDFTFEIPSAPAPVFYVTDPDAGAAFTSSTGTWKNGVLTLTPQQARKFTLSLIERPGGEPLGYWSMNDVPFHTKTDPEPGVIGGAFTPGGTDGKHHLLDSGISTAAVKNGGTFMAWVKRQPPKPGAKTPSKSKSKSKPQPSGPQVQPIFSAGEGQDAFLLPCTATDEQWHHVTVTFSRNHATLYVDGENRGPASVKLPATPANFFIGSVGTKTFLQGLLDEVRIYDRVLPPGEIHKIYAREKAASETVQPSR